MIDPWASIQPDIFAWTLGGRGRAGPATAVTAAPTAVVGVVIAQRLWHSRARSEGCQQEKLSHARPTG
jgi:hypothetical protein